MPFRRLLVALGAVGVILLSQAPLFSQSSKLVGYWKLDEASGNAADAHSNGLTLTNSSVTYAAGLLNNAGDFEASGVPILSRADDPLFDFGTGDFAISVWVKREAPTGTLQYIAHQFTGGTGWVMYFYTDDKIYVDTGAAAAYTSVNTTGTYTSTAAWYHIIFQRSNNGADLTIYVDNVNAGQTLAGTARNINNADDFALGADAVSGFDGLIDEVGLFNDDLTSDERSCLYGSGTPPAYSFGSCAAAAVTPRMMLLGVGP
jgi:hypothetical protein